MLLVTLFMLVVLLISAFYVWPLLDESQPNRRKRADPGGTEPRPVPRPESLEGVLVAQLMAGEITRDQYLKAVEGLAARDDERHPLAVPREIGPADA